MEIIKDLYWFGGISIVIIVGIMGFALPHTLRIFRLPRMYNRAWLFLTVLFVIGIALQFYDTYDCLERKNLFYPAYGILFLVLYKISDNFIKKKLGRHMYYLTLWQIKDEESIKSTNLENIIQFANILITFCLPYYASVGIVKLLYSC